MLLDTREHVAEFNNPGPALAIADDELRRAARAMVPFNAPFRPSFVVTAISGSGAKIASWLAGGTTGAAGVCGSTTVVYGPARRGMSSELTSVDWQTSNGVHTIPCYRSHIPADRDGI